MTKGKHKQDSTVVNTTQIMDWQHWYDRWEGMQNAYLPHRAARFDLMFRLPNFPQESKLQILDLGCGPGSLSYAALQHFPHAHIIAVDTDSVLLAVAEAVATECTGHVTFLNADFRDPNWWEPYTETFNLVVSATALHWLSSDHLAEVYARVYRILQPGGWFFNADHIASNDPNTQKKYLRLLSEWRGRNFQKPDTEDWETYWQALHAALNSAGISFTTPEANSWEGIEGGLPQSHHIHLLKSIGFENINFHWQYLGEALLGAQKPACNKHKRLNAYVKSKTADQEK